MNRNILERIKKKEVEILSHNKQHYFIFNIIKKNLTYKSFMIM